MMIFEKKRKSGKKRYRVYRSALGLVLGLHEGATCDIVSIHGLEKMWFFEKLGKSEKKRYRVYRGALGLVLGLHGIVH